MFVKTPKIFFKLFPSIIWKKNTDEKKLWLTFDDGPCLKTTPLILSILNDLEIKATFFLVGQNIEKFPELTNEIIKSGHIVGNHTYSHKDGFITNNTIYFKDIEKNNKIENKAMIFRPPYGRITFTQIKYLRKKYKIIMWDVFTWDFKKKRSKRIKKNILNNVEKGSIIVLHNNSKSYQNLKESLKSSLIELKNLGYSFSTTW